MNQTVLERAKQDTQILQRVGDALFTLSEMLNVTFPEPKNRITELHFAGITGRYKLTFLFTKGGELVAWQLQIESDDSAPSLRIGAIESFEDEVETAMQQVWYESKGLDPRRPYDGKDEDVEAMIMAGLAAISLCQLPHVTLCVVNAQLVGFEMVEKSAASEAPELPFYDFNLCYAAGKPTGWRLNMHYRGQKLTRMSRSDLFSEEIAGAVQGMAKEFSLLDRLAA